MKPNIVKQNDSRDCGACCLLSLIEYYKGYIPLETIRLDTKTNQNGTTAYHLIEAAHKYGFEAFGVKKEEQSIEKEILPCIAHIVLENGCTHFVVVYKIDKKYVYCMDPAKGYTKTSIEEWNKVWTNIILLFKPYQTLPQYQKENSLLNTLLHLMIKDKRIFTKIILLNLVITLFSIGASYYFQITASLTENSTTTFMLFVMLLFLFLTILKVFYSHIRNTLSIYLNKNIDIRLIVSFIHHIFKLPLDVIKSRTTGEIITRITDLNHVKNLFSEIILTIVLDFILVISTTCFLFKLQSQLFLILCLMASINMIAGIIFAPIIYKVINNNIDLETAFNSSLIEKIDAIETIKNLSLTKDTIEEIDTKYASYLDSYFQQQRLINLYTSIRMAIKEIGCFLITSLGILLVMKNTSSFLSIITFNSLLYYFYDPFEEIISMLPKYLFIRLSFSKVNSFIGIKEEEEGKKEHFSKGVIEFQNIEFSYLPTIPPIVKNFSLEIPKNAHITIRGASGSGKSTLCKMLNRTIEEYKGKITINGICIKDYNIHTIRKNILYISQREKIFDGTIKENITLHKNIPIEKIQQVIEICEIEEILEKKSLRLDSYLYDSGFNLSGGERQRIILARTLLLKGPILILDEALSEIDEKTEEKIITKIDAYCKEKTILYISHKGTNYFKDCLEMESKNV